MPSYFIDNKAEYCYIKESTSYWDKDIKKPRSKQKNIGKVDKETGRITFYDDFIKKSTKSSLKINGQEIVINDPNNYLDLFNKPYRESIYKNLNINNENSNDDIVIDDRLLEPLDKPICPAEIYNFKIFGSTYFLKKIAEKSKVLDILKDVFPKIWQQILNLLLFIVLKNDKMSYCEHFVKEYYSYSNCNMKSQRISEMLDRITNKQRDKFYSKWIKIVQESEFLALDITSISSDSENLEEVSFGHNKENNKMKQFNLCMLFGEKTYLPMYQTIYHGSLVDNKTLANTIIEFSAIVGSFNFKLVMDRGFYSLDNIKFMITKVGLKFIIGVPFTTNYSKKLVENVIDHIDRANNYIKTSSKGDTIKGLHRHVAIINDKIKVINDKELENYSNFIILSAFVYYNSNKRLRELNKLTKNLAEAKGDIVKDNSNIVKYKDFVDKFFDITYSNGVIVNISINEDKLSEHVKFYGYSVYLSNDTFNTEETYLYYVKKDVVEKSFHHFKAYLGLDRPYCHGNKRLLNKSFIMQLCQIIYCSIHKIMQDKDLFDQFPIKKMLAIMSELKSFNIKDCEYLRPITSKQKKIYKYFDIQLPSIKDNKIDF